MRNELWIPIVGMLIPIVIAPTAIITKYLYEKRQWTHRERMRAIEMGLMPVPEGRAWPALVAIAVGAGVPIGSFLMAWMATLTAHADTTVFGAAAFVSVVAIVAATKLTGRMLDLNDLNHAESARRMAAARNGQAHDHAKPPALDPDAYDIASRRG
jgi:hypothetical protein